VQTTVSIKNQTYRAKMDDFCTSLHFLSAKTAVRLNTTNSGFTLMALMQ